MVCDIADLRCIYVNELIGDPILTFFILAIIFFGFASYKKMGLKTTLWFSCIYFPVTSYVIAGSSVGFALFTFIASFLVAFIHTRITGNR